MADETQLESNPSGNQDLPTPEFSDKGDSSTSKGADELVSKLIAQLEPIIEKKVQSVKDKRFSEIEKALGGRDRMLAELEESGVTIPKEVRQEMRLRELEERLTQSPTQSTPERVDGSTQQKVAVTDAIAKLNEYGLSTNDPAFIELLRGKYPNRDAFDKAVLAHVVEKLKPTKPANPADVVQSPATQASSGKLSGDEADKKYGELGTLLKNPSINAGKISQLKKELKDSGYEVD